MEVRERTRTEYFSMRSLVENKAILSQLNKYMLIKYILLAPIFEFVLCLGHDYAWHADVKINHGKEKFDVLVSITHYWINLNILDLYYI